MNETQLRDWFTSLKEELETAYLKNDKPWEQSGYYGSEEKWVQARKPVADCIETSGSFLDIGCANGYLIECVIRWTAERNLTVSPYGLDISEKLVELARARLPGYSANLYTGNGWDWENPVKFDYIRTELVYVPEHLRKRYIERIMKEYLVKEGRLLLCEYGRSPASEHGLSLKSMLEEWGYSVVKQVSGYYDGDALASRVTVVESRL